MRDKVTVHTGDGLGGSGKGTIGSWLNKQGVPHLDTGQGYRATTEYWLRLEADHDPRFDRSDTERLQARAEAFSENDTGVALFADSLFRAVAFGVKGVRIGRDQITNERISEVLYHDSVNNTISYLARKQPIRRFCGQVSVQFVLDAAAQEVAAVYLDGRNERNVVINGLRHSQRLRTQARLGLPAFFKVEAVEAAHRTLSRDLNIPYRSLPDDDPRVVARAQSLEARNRRDSDTANHADPMGVTAEHIRAWDLLPTPDNVAWVVGNQSDGSDSKHVVFDTTKREKHETQEEYGWWLDGVSHHYQESNLL